MSTSFKYSYLQVFHVLGLTDTRLRFKLHGVNGFTFEKSVCGAYYYKYGHDAGKYRTVHERVSDAQP